MVLGIFEIITSLVAEKVIIIIQARLGSTRLPGKIFKHIDDNLTFFEFLINRLKQNILSSICVATTTNPNDDVIEELCKKKKVNCYRGDEENVLIRFYNCAKVNGAGKVIRVCSDNPFIDIEDLKLLLKTEGEYDYVSFSIKGTPSIKTHYGFWAELVSINALQKIINSTSDKLYYEHVTNYIYTNPDKFNIKLIDRSDLVPEFPIRLTLDTLNDYNNIIKIYELTKASNVILNKENIIEIIRKRTDLIQSMNDEIKSNTK